MVQNILLLSFVTCTHLGHLSPYIPLPYLGYLKIAHEDIENSCTATLNFTNAVDHYYPSLFQHTSSKKLAPSKTTLFPSRSLWRIS